MIFVSSEDRFELLEIFLGQYRKGARPDNFLLISHRNYFYLIPFSRYSELLVKVAHFSYPSCIDAPIVVTPLDLYSAIRS